MSQLQLGKTGVLLIDVQERLFPHIDRSEEIKERISFFLRFAKLAALPLVISEQVPESLGSTLPDLLEIVGTEIPRLSKSHFSFFRDPVCRAHLEKISVTNWILLGIETHICVLQTAKEMKESGLDLVVPNDTTSSRSLYAFSTALGELRDLQVRVSSAETLVYELIEDANSPLFHQVLPLVREQHVS